MQILTFLILGRFFSLMNFDTNYGAKYKKKIEVNIIRFFKMNLG